MRAGGPNRSVLIGTVIVSVAAGAALLAPFVVPYDAASQDLPLRLAGPSTQHWFGLDELGRDVLARVLIGSRVSFLVGLSVVSVSALVGMALGSIAGFFGGIVDDAVSRGIDILMAFPGILLAIALVAVLGPSLGHVILALSAIGWVAYARLVRGQVLKTREVEFVQAARALGAGPARIIMLHLLPTALPTVLVQATLGMAGAIIAEAALSFLGLGVQPPAPSWGGMLSGGRAHLLDAPHLTIFPGVAIALLVLGFNFLGDGLRDAIDPRMRR